VDENDDSDEDAWDGWGVSSPLVCTNGTAATAVIERAENNTLGGTGIVPCDDESPLRKDTAATSGTDVYVESVPIEKESMAMTTKTYGVQYGLNVSVGEESRSDFLSCVAAEYQSTVSTSSLGSSPLAHATLITLTANALATDERLSEILHVLRESQTRCRGLWAPKKVSENAFLRVAVRSYNNVVPV
jgi:hypothetical protein